MLDIKFIRENPGLVKENMKKKFLESKVVDDFLKHDKAVRVLKKQIDDLRKSTIY